MLASAALSGGLASATTLCEERGGTLSTTNLIVNESGGTFGTIASSGSTPTYRDLATADIPGSPYSYGNNADGTGLLRPEASYAITSQFYSGSRLDTYGPWQAYTGHTTGAADDAYLAVNGAVSQATFMKQMVTLQPNTNYEVGLWGRSPHSAASAYGGTGQEAQLAISAGTLATGTTHTLLRGDAWERGSIIFNSGNQTSVPVTYRNISTVAQGNDFYVDDIFLQKCTMPSGTISGTVYVDANSNGVQDGAERGLAGVTVQTTDKNGSVASAITDAAGNYTFPNLTVFNSAYTVSVLASSAPLANLVPTTPTSKSGVTPVPNATVQGGNFGYVPPVPNSGTCTVNAPYVQNFNASGAALAEVRNHSYLSSGNAVTTTDGTYTLWDQINNSGTSGYGLYYNIANFEGKNGGTLNTPGLLYESQITVPAGATINYENYLRSHADNTTQLQYRFYDGVSGTLLKSYDGAFATTTYARQSVPSFVSPSSKVIIRLYTLKDGTTADTNVLKLDDLKLSCGTPVTPALSIVKTHSPATFQVLQPATYTLTVSNAANAATTSGPLTVQDQLPVGIGASLPSGFSPAAGWTCSYSGEAEQKTGYTPNPNEAQLLTCTTTNVLAAGASVALNIPVNVTPTAGASVLNKASVGGGGDPDPLPDPLSCTLGAQCAQDTAPVLPLSAPPATCAAGTPTNLLTSPLKGYDDNDSATLSTDAALLSNAAAYLNGTGASGSFVIDGSYYFNNGYGPLSKASILQLIVNDTVYASFLTQDAYSGSATVTAENGATLPDGVSSVQLNRYSTSRVWVTLPTSVTSISSVKIKFVSSAPGGSVGDDYGFNIGTILACIKPLPKLTVVKTVQNITANGPVGSVSSGNPGDVLEYCIITTNIGGANATKLAFSDSVPSNTSAFAGAYTAGKDIKVTAPTGVSYLTFATDGDTGQLDKGAIVVSLPNLILAPTQTFSVCFQAKIG